MVYSSKDFNDVDFCRDSAKHASMMAFAAPKVESLWFLYLAEGLPKNISIESFCVKHGVLCKQSGVAERISRLSTTDGTASTEPYWYEFCQVVTEVEYRSNDTGSSIRRFLRLQ